jgi:hypothetical protein
LGTLKLVPTSQNKIYEHKIDFNLREREATHEKATDWVEERKRLSKRARERERERERERKEQIGSQDLKLAGVKWLHKCPEFLAGAVGVLLKNWSLTFDRVTYSLIFNMDCVRSGWVAVDSQ